MSPEHALPGSAARIFLGAADTWYPPAPDGAPPGASDLDLLAQLPAHLAPGEARRLAVELRLLDWLPRLRLHRGGFCWLGLAERQAVLAALEGSPLGPLRRRVERLRGLVDACYRAARAQASSGSA